MFLIIDLILAAIGVILLSPLFVTIYFVLLFESGSPFYFQKRVGLNQKEFVLIKFRSMKLDTESVASHLVDASSITSIGGFLRRTKLDELPQLFNVLLCDMSFVGPRPCLPNQNELILERSKKEIFSTKPGITGLAQIAKIDMSTPKLLSKVDELMIKKKSFCMYFAFIYLSIVGYGAGDVVKNK